MKLQKTELEKALAIVKPGLASKDLIEQATSFAFINGSVITYNDEISISHPIKNLDLEGAIKAEELYLFLKKVKQEEIDLTITENEIQFKAGRTRAGFVLQKEVSLPLKSLKKKGKWGKLPEEFCHYLKMAMGAAGRDMSEPILTCVNIRKDGFMDASDNYKLIRCETGEEMPLDDFLLPAEAAVKILPLKPTHITSGKGWVHFKNKDNTVISCRIYPEDTYPDKSKWLDIDGIKITIPKTMIEILDRCAIFSKRVHILDEEIKIHIEKGKMQVDAKSDTGWIKDSTKIKHSDDPITFSITRYLLADILKEADTFLLSEKALRFEGAGWIYISALRNV